jgi:acyl-CoA thioester hydrolase
MAEPFRVSVVVRGYELDTQGHLNQAVYLNYAEHARWEILRAAGVAQDKLLASGVGPVALETTIRYLRELRGGDEVTVTCAFEWGTGKTFRMVQHLERDGELAAEVLSVGGLLDLTARRLIPEPGKHLRSLATAPELLGV